MKRIVIAVLALWLMLPACAFALTGQSYTAFETLYKANVSFINENVGRHLLPMVLSQRASDQKDGRVVYELFGDVLTVTVTVDAQDIIEDCEVHLIKPAGMEYGNSVYNDFAISGYHSYAFLMAMSSDAEPADRYALVTDIEKGLTDNNGTYVRQLGAYTVTCTLDLNQGGVFHFQNNGVMTQLPSPGPSQSPKPDDKTDTTAPSDAPADAPADADDFVG